VDNYIENIKNEITKWENEGPGYLETVGEKVLWPIQKAAELLIPKGMNDRMATAIEMALSGLGNTTCQHN